MQELFEIVSLGSCSAGQFVNFHVASFKGCENCLTLNGALNIRRFTLDRPPAGVFGELDGVFRFLDIATTDIKRGSF